jgi:hypothetical protein
MTKEQTLNHPRWAALSDKRQNELLEEYRDVNVDHEWWDFTYEDFKAKAHDLGIAVTDISFSGFWSQGDGACFSGHVDDWHKILTATKQTELLQLAEENHWYFQVTSRGSYCHSYTMYGNLDAPIPENPYEEETEPLQYDAWEIKHGPIIATAEALEDDLQTYFRDLADDLYKDLEQEYNCLTEDEQIVDWILDNLDDDELKDPDDIDEEDTVDEQVNTNQLELDFA